MMANDPTEDDRKDLKGWLKSKLENGENTLGDEAEEQPYNPDNDTDEEGALPENHRKTPPHTHAPKFSLHTGDNKPAAARQTPSLSRKLP